MEANKHKIICQFFFTCLFYVSSSITQLDFEILGLNDKKFWWGDGVNKKKFHIIKWSELCKPIEKGGLGIRKSKCQNCLEMHNQYKSCHNLNMNL